MLIVDVEAGDVPRQQVGGELHPLEGGADAPGQGLGDQGLSQTRNVFDQHMAFGQERDQKKLDGMLLPDNYMGYVFNDPLTQIKMHGQAS